MFAKVLPIIDTQGYELVAGHLIRWKPDPFTVRGSPSVAGRWTLKIFGSAVISTHILETVTQVEQCTVDAAECYN